jgi:hypothetical protein
MRKGFLSVRLENSHFLYSSSSTPNRVVCYGAYIHGNLPATYQTSRQLHDCRLINKHFWLVRHYLLGNLMAESRLSKVSKLTIKTDSMWHQRFNSQNQSVQYTKSNFLITGKSEIWLSQVLIERLLHITNWANLTK